MAPKKTRASERALPSRRSPPSLLLDVAAEAVAHGGEHLVLELVLAARGEALEERRGQHVRRHALVDGGLHRPAALARVGDPAREAVERRVARRAPAAVRSSSHEVTTLPRRHTSAIVGEVEVVPVVLGLRERRRLGVVLVRRACRRWRAAGC